MLRQFCLDAIFVSPETSHLLHDSSRTLWIQDVFFGEYPSITVDAVKFLVENGVHQIRVEAGTPEATARLVRGRSGIDIDSKTWTKICHIARAGNVAIPAVADSECSAQEAC